MPNYSEDEPLNIAVLAEYHRQPRKRPLRHYEAAQDVFDLYRDLSPESVELDGFPKPNLAFMDTAIVLNTSLRLGQLNKV